MDFKKSISSLYFYIVLFANLFLLITIISNMDSLMTIIQDFWGVPLVSSLFLFFKKHSSIFLSLALYLYFLLFYLWILSIVDYCINLYGKYQDKIKSFIKKVFWIILFVATTICFWVIGGKEIALTIAGGAILFFILEKGIEKFSKKNIVSEQQTLKPTAQIIFI